MGLAGVTLTVAMVIIIAALGTLLVQRSVDLEVRRAHHGVGSVVFLQLGVIYAVLLAFVFNDVWADYQTAEQAINSEVGALHGLSILALTLRPDQARTILGDELAYVTSVLGVEWPRMAKNRAESLDTDRKLQKTMVDVASLKPLDGDSVGIRDQMLNLLATAHAERETRIYQANKGTPAAIWAVLAMFSFVLGLSVWCSSLEGSIPAMVIAATFAAAIASILIVIRLLDYPFEGALALQPNDFHGLLVKITHLYTSL